MSGEPDAELQPELCELGRLARAAWLVVPMHWKRVVGFDFKHPAHINILEIVALQLPLATRATRELKMLGK